MNCSSVLLRKLNEIGRSLHFSAQINDNPRLAYSNSLMIWYSTFRATKYNRIQPNYPRLTLPREHFNAATKAYALPRDWSVEMGDDRVNHIN